LPFIEISSKSVASDEYTFSVALVTHPRDWYRLRDGAALGAAVESIRRASGRTQEELAEQLATERSSIRRLEQGRLAIVNRLIAALGACGYELIAVPRGSKVTVD
jgi:DNA-binding XRE family transcriptional regulator